MVQLTENEFRKKNQSYSFSGFSWSAAGSAAFFGAAGTIATGLVGLATGVAGAAVTALTSGVGLLALGALIAVGLGCMYMSQKAFTELRVIQDEHMAKTQERALQHVHDVPVPTIVKSSEYEQNQRKDGKTWVQTTEGRDSSGLSKAV